MSDIQFENDGYCAFCCAELLNGIALIFCHDCGAGYCSHECHDRLHEEGDFQ